MLLLWEFRSDEFYHPPRMGTNEGERVSLKHFRFSQGGEVSSKENSANTQESAQPPKPLQESPQPQRPKPASQKSAKPQPKQAQSKLKDSKPPQSKAESESLAQSLSRPPASLQNAPQTPSIYDFGKDMSNQEIKDLYGEEFGSLDTEQRKFIKDNLSGIGRITQRYLKYPTIAGKMGQQGDNIVEFYLHPNGDISELKLLTPSGFRLLDDNSMHTIRIAYKDYPYPSVKTKIRIRVMYRVY